MKKLNYGKLPVGSYVDSHSYYQPLKFG